jgi:hypothetical protein
MNRNYNIKALFVDGKLDRLILGDFGPVEDKPRAKAGSVTVDALIAFPMDPELCGPTGVANNLRCPVTSRFWANPKFDRE